MYEEQVNETLQLKLDLLFAKPYVHTSNFVLSFPYFLLQNNKNIPATLRQTSSCLVRNIFISVGSEEIQLNV
jgi:hypothetical protein